jgi:hypothetical protein
VGVSRLEIGDLRFTAHMNLEIEQESKIFASPRLLSESKYRFLGAVKKAALALPDAPNVSQILEIAFIDELQTFVGKKIQIRVMDNCQPFSAGILAGFWAIASKTCAQL